MMANLGLATRLLEQGDDLWNRSADQAGDAVLASVDSVVPVCR